MTIQSLLRLICLFQLCLTQDIPLSDLPFKIGFAQTPMNRTTSLTSANFVAISSYANASVHVAVNGSTNHVTTSFTDPWHVDIRVTSLPLGSHTLVVSGTLSRDPLNTVPDGSTSATSQAKFNWEVVPPLPSVILKLLLSSSVFLSAYSLHIYLYTFVP